ncbi:hypothetical protein N825_30880 [Skermanella stibiiresistens SB22]|uniref:Uncharacterized protein n=1 Tax=Skermanella stibiiresistens SB22 TaxID=1385369 RepID=W9HBI5_9PROT|nr:hypothetical protein N825_30880 [Skermanella stibiiresistens SB22]
MNLHSWIRQWVQLPADMPVDMEAGALTDTVRFSAMASR